MRFLTINESMLICCEKPWRTDARGFRAVSVGSAAGYGPRQIVKRARETLDKLYEEHGLYSEVINKLKANQTLEESVRKIALQIANARLWEDEE